ncbi:MAG: DUF2493 domain-containing protein [Ruminococcaceae bacterium]|nr:DUF2493 domain-containing protein [Oscillospiraceae bacterium]
MKLLIAGSRGIASFDLSDLIPQGTALIISGGAMGIDTIAENFADNHGIEKRIFSPEYELYGKAAPLVRNKAMVDFCDAALIICDGRSRGTKFTIEYARKCGKEVKVVII